MVEPCPGTSIPSAGQTIEALRYPPRPCEVAHRQRDQAGIATLIAYQSRESNHSPRACGSGGSGTDSRRMPPSFPRVSAASAVSADGSGQLQPLHDPLLLRGAQGGRPCGSLCQRQPGRQPSHAGLDMPRNWLEQYPGRAGLAPGQSPGRSRRIGNGCLCTWCPAAASRHE